jgi:hypothetical protein
MTSVVQAAVQASAHDLDGTVDLSDLGLCSADLGTLRSALLSWSASATLRLDLSRNRLQDDGARIVAKALKSNATIEELDLSSSDVADEGTLALAKMLTRHPTVSRLKLRKNALTDLSARALVIAAGQNRRIIMLDLAKNKGVSYSMQEAARLAVESNCAHAVAMQNLETLATVWDTVERIKTELGLNKAASPAEAIAQAAELLGLGQTGVDEAAPGVEPSAEPSAETGVNAPAAAADPQNLEQKTEAIAAELGIQVNRCPPTSSSNSAIRSLALGYTVQPAGVARLDVLARGVGIRINQVLTMARAQKEAEDALAAADINPVMEDERRVRRRQHRAKKAAPVEVAAPAATVREQLEGLLLQALGLRLLSESAKAKIIAKVEAGRLNPTTCMMQWSERLQQEAAAARTGIEATGQSPQESSGMPPDEWREVVDDTSGDTYYYNRISRETTWERPPQFKRIPQAPSSESEGESDGQEFQEWTFEKKIVTIPTALPGNDRRDSARTAEGESGTEADTDTSDQNTEPQDSARHVEIPVGDIEFRLDSTADLGISFQGHGDRVLVKAVRGQAAIVGIEPGMALSSVGGAPISSLSLEGALDQIDLCRAAGGAVFSIGFQTLPPDPIVFDRSRDETDIPAQPGDCYYVCFEDGAVIRSSFGQGSSIVGKLEHLDRVITLESRTSFEGIVRIKCSRGWVSTNAGDGTRFLQKIHRGVGGGSEPAENLMATEGDQLTPRDVDEVTILPRVMPPPKTTIQKAMSAVERALEHDEAGQIAEAIAGYQRAAALLHAGAKEKSVSQANYFRSKATEYLTRANQLSEFEAETRRKEIERQNLFMERVQQAAVVRSHMAAAAAEPTDQNAEKKLKRALKKMAKSIENASVDDVCTWLVSLGLAHCADTFQEQQIDGLSLAELTDQQLRNDLGIKMIGDRSRIRRERDALKRGVQEPASAPAAPLSRRQDAAGTGLGTRTKVSAMPRPTATHSDQRIKLKCRWGHGGDWLNMKVDADDLNLAAIKQRIAAAMQVSTLALNYMQYQDAEGDWYTLMNDEDIHEVRLLSDC